MTSAASASITSTAPLMTSIAAATLCAVPAVSDIPPTSFSLLPPRLAVLL
jgi:hypothetical protein